VEDLEGSASFETLPEDNDAAGVPILLCEKFFPIEVLLLLPVSLVVFEGKE
jgi:hypothetical protein